MNVVSITYIVFNMIECLIAKPSLLETQQMQRWIDSSVNSFATSGSIKSVPSSSSSSSSPSPSPSSSVVPFSSASLTPQSAIQGRKDDSQSSSADVHKSPGTFTFSYKIKDGNNTIERSEKQSPNGSLNGHYTVKNLVNGFLRSIFYSADVDSFSASVFSNKPGDVNYTFPESTVATTTEASIVDLPTAVNNGVEKEELNVISEVSSVSQVNSTEGDFELVTSVVVDMVDPTTVKEEAEITTEVTSTATTVDETTTAASVSAVDVTSTTSEGVNESSSEAPATTPDSLSIPDGPIVSAEIVGTSTPVSVETPVNTSETSILPSLWYEYEILLNGGRFYRSESTDPITGKLIGSYILLMDSQGGKATDASTVTPPAAAAAAATSMSSSTVTSSEPFIGQSEVDKLASSSQPPTPSSVSESNASGKQVEEGNSVELSPQEKQEAERSTSSTASTVEGTPVTAATTTPISVTNSVMSSTVQSIAPAGDTSTSEEVIRRLRRVQRLRKRHNIQPQPQEGEERRRSRQLQSTTRSNVQVSRSNYTSDLSTVARKKQKHASSHLKQIDHQSLMV